MRTASLLPGVQIAQSGGIGSNELGQFSHTHAVVVPHLPRGAFAGRLVGRLVEPASLLAIVRHDAAGRKTKRSLKRFITAFDPGNSISVGVESDSALPIQLSRLM